MLVTDIIRKLKSGKEVKGFYMDGYLKENLDPIPKFLEKDWDCVGIVSGHGKVRIGKSTMAIQMGYYLAWLLAGGKMITHREGKKWVVDDVVSPDKPVRFSLEENLVYSSEELVDAAEKLHEKYGKNQVIIYDEGRQGLDSARAMESVNKGMEDFFQECGVYNHIILIVLPNFFKLHEDYAVSRSFFLIDCFHDRKYNKGFFNFYNEHQKELLYFFGKKKLGITARYSAANESFWGRFGPWMPFDKDKYDEKKRNAIRKKKLGRRDKGWKLQRDVMVYVMNKVLGRKYEEIQDDFERYGAIKVSKELIKDSIQKIKDKLGRM